MERRHQVFVSSTFLDLQEERAAVVSSLLELDAIPAGMELFPAADDDAWTLIERVIEESDYYLLVIGGRYGAIDPATSISFTEKEYDLAVRLKKPVMAFVHGKPQDIPFGKSEQDQETRAKLDAFRSKVETTKHVKYWAGPEDLAGKVALSYAKFRQMYPSTGWIRGDVQVSAEALAELHELRKKLAAAEERIDAARSAPPPGTERLAQGSDIYRFDALAEVTVKTTEDEWIARPRQAWLSVEVSWDVIFSAVGPTMLDEASQGAVHGTINGLLRDLFYEEARDVVSETVRANGAEIETVGGVAVRITDDDFGTVLIQLRALGLIARSDRKRSVSDTATYWTLTDFGDEYLTTLRAIRREGDAAESPQQAGDREPV